MIRFNLFCRSSVFLLVFFTLGGCNEEKETPAPIPEDTVKKTSKQLSNAIELKADEISAKQLAQDSNETELVQLLTTNKQKIQQLHITLKVAEKMQNSAVISSSKTEIEQRQIETETEIAKYYRIVRIPFVHINNYKLLPESQEYLEGLQEQLCNPDYKIIIYGYGGYIGSEAATKKISHLRAKAVSKWLKAHTACKTLTRGLGIDIRAREIQDVQLPKDKHDSVLEESRYVRIYIHR